ncbi:MAG: hypothetical protein QOF51_1490 [Chloroflexota bacterium]|nr:hypothetical protein [Chloroflexota bacterium]
MKLLFGEHIWDVAQHADALGKRTFELRLPLQHSLPPADAYVDLLTDIAAIGLTPERIAAVYDVILPGLARRYRRYLSETDTLLDAPTVRILERWLFDWDRMLNASRKLREELGGLQLADPAWAEPLRAREAAIDDVIISETAAAAVEA